MAEPDRPEILADISQREPDFYGRNGAPIWCSGELSLEDIRDLMRSEGVLIPSERMHNWMRANGCWNIRRRRG